MQFNTEQFLRFTQKWLHNDFQFSEISCKNSQVFSGISLLYSFSFLRVLLFLAKFAVFAISGKHWHIYVDRYLLSKRRAEKENNSTAYFKVTSFLCSTFYFIFHFVLCLQIYKFSDGKQYFFTLSTVAFHGCFLFFSSFFCFPFSPLFSGCLKYVN